MRRAVTILVVLAVVIGGSLLTYRYTTQAKEPPPPDYETIRVSRGQLVSTVSATGTIEPEDEVGLSFKATGRVSEVMVREGEAVTAGEVMARLETDDLALNLAQSEVGLAISQAQLAKLQTAAKESEIKSAEANITSAQAAAESATASLASARANLQDLLAGPTADEREAAAASVERARIVRDQAQAAYDQVATLPNVGLLPQSVQLQQATVDVQAAEANYRLTVAAPKQSQVAAARAQVAQAEATLAQTQATLAQAELTLEQLLEGPSAEDLAVAEAQVTQAQLSVQQARLATEGSELTTPIAGVVTELNIKRGELPNAARSALVITDISRFHIDIDVDEIDIGKLQVGQPVQIALDALSDAELTGHIDFIAPAPTTGTAIVSYQVTVVIDASNVPLRSGLSATATITTEALEDILVVPNRAIEVDRSSGRAYVERIVDGVPTRTEIQIGSRNERDSQVVSGLEEGDELAIRSGTGRDQLRAQFFGG